MVRSCHLDTCPVGIATQRPELRAKFAGDAGDGRGLPPASSPRRCGGCSPRSACARSTRPSAASTCCGSARPATPRADALDLAPLLGAARARARALRRASPCRTPGDRLGALLAAQGTAALERRRGSSSRRTQITNGDRAVGARLGGAIARRVGSAAAARARPRPLRGLRRPELRRVPHRRRRARPRRRGERLRRQGDERRPHRRSRRRADDAGDPCLARQHRALRRDRRRAVLRRVARASASPSATRARSRSSRASATTPAST